MIKLNQKIINSQISDSNKLFFFLEKKGNRLYQSIIEVYPQKVETHIYEAERDDKVIKVNFSLV